MSDYPMRIATQIRSAPEAEYRLMFAAATCSSSPRRRAAADARRHPDSAQIALASRSSGSPQALPVGRSRSSFMG